MRANYRLEAYSTLQRPVVDVGTRGHKQGAYYFDNTSSTRSTSASVL